MISALTAFESCTEATLLLSFGNSAFCWEFPRLEGAYIPLICANLLDFGEMWEFDCSVPLYFLICVGLQILLQPLSLTFSMFG
jgi:hypothetical protein